MGSSKEEEGIKREVGIKKKECLDGGQVKKRVRYTLLAKCWRISLYLTDEAIAQLYMT